MAIPILGANPAIFIMDSGFKARNYKNIYCLIITFKIELDRGEEFFMTVKEAEDKDYRRAWRWRGKKD